MYEKEKKRVCYHCVNEGFLKAEIKRTGKTRKCSYCEQIAVGISLLELANKIEVAFSEFYQRSSQEPTSWEYHLISDKESDYQWDRHGSPVIDTIMEAAEIEENIASEVQEVLKERFYDFDLAAMGEETEFETDSYYEWKSPNDAYWQREWEEFERRLKSEVRHFNQFGAKLLDNIFDGIDQMKTVDGNSLIKSIGPNTDIPFLLRARVFQSDDRLKEALSNPEQHLGPPPQQHAIPGRMNARGISMFYSAIEQQVALAEVRPPVGSKVVVTSFKVSKELKLLDLSAVSKVNTKGSIFDEKYKHRLQRDIFLQRLSKRISNPVMPEDEPMDYLITQAIADYLATESKTTFDGIIYPSVQVNNESINVVLFYKSARVFPLKSKLDVDLGSYTDEGWEWNYMIKKGRVKAKKKTKPIFNDLLDVDLPMFKDADERECTLEIDVDTIKIHHIAKVNFDTKEHNVITY